MSVTMEFYFPIVSTSLKFNISAVPLFRNGIYPLMNFASSRPHPVPRALSLSQEQVETVKTPTPEPQETETRKVSLLDALYTLYSFSLFWSFVFNLWVKYPLRMTPGLH